MRFSRFINTPKQLSVHLVDIKYRIIINDFRP